MCIFNLITLGKGFQSTSNFQHFSKRCLVSNNLAQLSEPAAISKTNFQDHVLQKCKQVLSMPTFLACEQVKMALWEEIASVVPDPAVLRRALFAAAHVSTQV